jgi:hypothetical protein
MVATPHVGRGRGSTPAGAAPLAGGGGGGGLAAKTKPPPKRPYPEKKNPTTRKAGCQNKTQL